MIVQHNMASANTNRQLGITNTNLAKSTEKLSSGYRINRAGDDAAGLSISEKMRGQVRGLERASDNAQDGISLIQTAEGAMNEQHAILQRARELAVQAANDTNVTADRMAIHKELFALNEEFVRISAETEFNTQALLTGDFDNKYFQIGANNGQSIKVSIGATEMEGVITGTGALNSGDTTGYTDGVATEADVKDKSQVGTYALATAFIKKIDDNIVTLSTSRSSLGAIQNRLEYSIRNADNTAENLQSAESRIRDVDMAEEMTSYSKDSILQQAAQSMLAQANQATQGVLSLLQ